LDNVSFTDSPSIKGSFNDVNPSLPLFVIPSSKVKVKKITFDGKSHDREGSYVLTAFAGDSLVLDRMIDNFYAALIVDTTLEGYGLQFIEDFWTESDAGQMLINDKKVHFKDITLLFEVKNLG